MNINLSAFNTFVFLLFICICSSFTTSVTARYFYHARQVTAVNTTLLEIKTKLDNICTVLEEIKKTTYNIVQEGESHE